VPEEDEKILVEDQAMNEDYKEKEKERDQT